MSRFAFLVLLTGVITIAFDSRDERSAFAQEKGKKKKADAKAPTPKPEDIKEDFSRVLPVFDPGSHTQPISAMGFTTDNKKLVTVGQDFSVQVWSTATGERLDILRLPGYGREKGYDAGRWDVAAVSGDGTRVAIGGQVKLLSAEGEDRTGRLVVVDVVKRTVHRVTIRTGLNRPVTAVAFSPDGDMLAMAIEKGPKEAAVLIVVGNLEKRIANANPGVRTQDCQQVSLPTTATELAFSPDGKQLLSGGEPNKVLLWDVPNGAAPTPMLAKDVEVEGSTNGFAWSPDGQQFARTVDGGENSGLRGIELWNQDGTKVKTWKAENLNRLFTARAGKLYSVAFLDAKTLYVVANGPLPNSGGVGASLAAVIDIATGQETRVVADLDGILSKRCGTVSADSRLLAVTVAGNINVVIQPRAGGEPIYCGVHHQLLPQLGVGCPSAALF